jgi:hypothetical protein
MPDRNHPDTDPRDHQREEDTAPVVDVNTQNNPPGSGDTK